MLNDVKLAGFVKRNSGLRKTDHEDPVCNLVIATKRQYTTRDGKKKEEEAWVDVVAYDDIAEVCARNASEDSLVFVEGCLRTNRVEKNNQVIFKTNVIARRVLFLNRIVQGYEDTPYFKTKGGTQWKR